MAKQEIYFDHAAATAVHPEVFEAMQPFFSDNFYNPSATYAKAVEVRQALNNARAQVAYWLGAKSTEIVFTAGGSEANNLAIHGVMRQFPKGNIVVSGIEHESVLEPAMNYDCRVVNVQSDGRTDLKDLAEKIDKNTVLVSIMYANNEIGTIQPIKKIAEVIAAKKRQRKSKLPLYFHSDACQAANYLDLHISRLGVDMMTINGGKIYGPKQSGVLFVKAGTELWPLIYGGGQERGLRSGTENVAGAIGLATALDLVQSDKHKETKRLQELQAEFFRLIEAKLPNSVINGSRKRRLPNNVHLTLPGQDNETLILKLELKGILAAAGSACNASKDTPSHVLRAMGLSDKTARSSLRLTMGRSTTSQQVKKTVNNLVKIAGDYSFIL